MRLALACLSLMVIPAIFLIGGAWVVGTEESLFWTEAQEHLTELDQARQMNPAAVRRTPFAREILTLTGSANGAEVRARVCGSRAAGYDPLFAHLSERCARVALFRRVRSAAGFGLIVPALALVVLAGVKADFRRPGGASVLALWAAVRGMHLLLFAAALGAMAAPAILLENVGASRYGIAAAGCVGLFLWSRRQASAYLGPLPARRDQSMAGEEPARRRKRRRR
jgi:hypothetical protein